MASTDITERKNELKGPQNVFIENREKITVSGVTDVDSFDEETVILYTQKGQMTVQGSSLQMTKLSLEGGDVVVQGEISAVIYKSSADKGGFFSRLMK